MLYVRYVIGYMISYMYALLLLITDNCFDRTLFSCHVVTKRLTTKLRLMHESTSTKALTNIYSVNH